MRFIAHHRLPGEEGWHGAECYQIEKVLSGRERLLVATFDDWPHAKRCLDALAQSRESLEANVA